MKEDDVRYNICTGVRLKRRIGQPNGSQEFCSLCHIFSGIRIFRIHRKTAGHKCNHTARTNLIERFCEKIVVNREPQLIIGLIRNLVVSERNVTDRQIIKIPAIRSFKTRHLDFGVRIEFLSDTPTDGIKLHSIEIAVSHGVREHPEKVTDTHCRFQDISCFKPHLSDRIIDGTNDGRTGIVGIQGTGSCCGIFFRRQGCIKFSELLSPACFVFIKSICKSTPADILGKDFLFFRSRISPIKFQFF